MTKLELIKELEKIPDDTEVTYYMDSYNDNLEITHVHQNEDNTISLLN